MHRTARFFFIDRPRMTLAPLILVASILASPALAAPVFNVDLDMFVVSEDAFENTGPQVADSNPVSLSELLNIASATAYASAASGPGSVAVIGSATYSVTDPGFETSAQGVATAISTIDDVVFEGTGTLNGVMLTMDLSGTMFVSGTASVAVNSLSLSFMLLGQTYNGFRTVQIPSFFSDSGVLDGVWPSGQSSFSGTIVIGPFDNVPSNTNLTLRTAMSIAPAAHIFPNFPPIIGNAASAVGNLGSTLSFTSSGPVFTTTDPNFVTVNSVQGSIVNGMWTGSPVTAPPIPVAPAVPALSTRMAVILALLMGASAVLAGLRVIRSREAG